MINKAFLLSLLLVLLITSSCSIDLACGSKEKFKMTSQEFFDRNESKEGLTSEEIKEVNEEFNTLIDNCYKKYKDDLTLSERQQFWKDAVLFQFEKQGTDGKFSLSFDSDSHPELDSFIESEINRVIKDSGEDFAASFKKILKDEMPQLIDKFVNEIGKIGEELKKALEDIELNEK